MRKLKPNVAMAYMEISEWRIEVFFESITRSQKQKLKLALEKMGQSSAGPINKAVPSFRDVQWLKWGSQRGSAPAPIWAPCYSMNLPPPDWIYKVLFYAQNNAKLVRCGMGMGFAPTWLRQVTPPLLHMTTLTIVLQ